MRLTVFRQARSEFKRGLIYKRTPHTNGHNTAKAMRVLTGTITDISSSQWTANDLAQSDMA